MKTGIAGHLTNLAKAAYHAVVGGKTIQPGAPPFVAPDHTHHKYGGRNAPDPVEAHRRPTNQGERCSFVSKRGIVRYGTIRRIWSNGAIVSLGFGQVVFKRPDQLTRA